VRPGRLVVLVGALVATGALYLKHLEVDDALFRGLGGERVPTIWQEVGKWGRPAVVLAAALLVALCFRPLTGAWDRGGSVVAVMLGVAALAGVLVAARAAGNDAAVVTAALASAGSPESGAAAGVGFWVAAGGCGVVTAGALWDLARAWRRRGPEGGRESVVEDHPAALE